MIYCDNFWLLKDLDTETGVFNDKSYQQANENTGIMKMSCKVSLVLEKDEYGYYAYFPDLPGCQTQGDDLNEIVSNIKEAIELYLETLSSEEKSALLHPSLSENKIVKPSAANPYPKIK